MAAEGCDRERHDRLTDACRRRRRRLAALVAEGVTAVRVLLTDDMQIDDAIVQVVEYEDARGLQIRICGHRPTELAAAAAEDLIDEPNALGRWQNTISGRWRALLA